jgi:menaquinone-dependent protoporphyrinogen oxidase
MGATRIAVIYDTAEGQTARIATHAAERMRSEGAAVVLSEAGSAAAPEGFDAVLISSPVHAGHHGKHVSRYVREHREALEAVPNAFISVSLSAVKHDEKHDADTARMVRDFEAAVGWTPDEVHAVAGALPYTKYNFFIRWVMKRISRAEGGDTDTSRDYEYTDWDDVDAFASAFLARVRDSAASPARP